MCLVRNKRFSFRIFKKDRTGYIGNLSSQFRQIWRIRRKSNLQILLPERAKELGMDWWVTNKDFSSPLNTGQGTDELETLKKRIEILESHQKR